MMLSRIKDVSLKAFDQERLVMGSEFFNADWYASHHSLKGGSEKALSHFLRTRGRHDPSPTFSCNAYLADNPDVRDAGLNPLLHYLRFGKSEGRIVKDIHGRVSGDCDPELGDKALERLRQLFDKRFYEETNPDLDADRASFEHFMSRGWRQLRDPAPWFSVENYRSRNPDVVGQNPFSHYVFTGSREGRQISKSRRKGFGSTVETAKRLSVTAVAMVKNEADIIAVFASHLLALFDDIVIVDHQSDDGTWEFLTELAAQYPRVEILRLKEQSYVQSVTMTHVIRDRPRVREADWVFFLDADEFLPFANREDFHAALTTHRRCPVISLHWKNLIPATYWKSVVDISNTTEFFAPPALSPFQKIAFQPARLNLANTIVAQGNHTLIEALNGLEIQSFEANFSLLHLPIRSVDQLLLKLNQGVLAYQKIGRARDEGHGTHWSKMKEATVDQKVSDAFLNAMAVDYSEDKQSLAPIDSNDLENMGFRRDVVNFARSDISLQVTSPRSLGEMLMRLYAVDYSDAATKDAVSATRLETTKDGDLVRVANSFQEYAKLPNDPVCNVIAEPALGSFLQPSYRDIVDLVPSDWSGHIPFMFALVALTQPRRYVELGTLRGASFFAFAQAVQDCRLKSEAIAVSSWAVGSDRKEEFQDAHDTFRFIGSKYADMTGMLRMDYEKSLHRFADGSIDLMHFDGFCEADGLERALELWRPKFSDRGIVLVHDINAQGPSFGIWRVWDDLRARHPTLEFQHSQGLGLACVGSNCSPHLLALVEKAASDRDLKTLLQEHFKQQGQKSAELFSRRFDMAQMDLRVGNEAAVAEELSWYQQELSATRAEMIDLRALLAAELSSAAGV